MVWHAFLFSHPDSMLCGSTFCCNSSCSSLGSLQVLSIYRLKFWLTVLSEIVWRTDVNLSFQLFPQIWSFQVQIFPKSHICNVPSGFSVQENLKVHYKNNLLSHVLNTVHQTYNQFFIYFIHNFICRLVQPLCRFIVLV